MLNLEQFSKLNIQGCFTCDSINQPKKRCSTVCGFACNKYSLMLCDNCHKILGVGPHSNSLFFFYCRPFTFIQKNQVDVYYCMKCCVDESIKIGQNEEDVIAREGYKYNTIIANQNRCKPFSMIIN